MGGKKVNKKQVLDDDIDNTTSSNNPLLDEVDKATTSIKDLRKMMKKDIPENSTPYVRASIEYTHEMIDDFFKDVVIPQSKNGRINCSYVVDAWKIYQEGRETEKMYSNLEDLLDISKEQMEYWKNIFELPVNEMLKFGRSTLLYGHEVLTLYYRRWLLETKYKQFFNNPDPQKWIQKKADIRDFEVNNLEYSKLDMRKYTEKISCIVNGGVRIG